MSDADEILRSDVAYRICLACRSQIERVGHYCRPEEPRKLAIKFARTRPEAVIPTYATDGSSGLDLYACEDAEIGYGRSVFFDTGIAVEFPVGYEGQVRGRSSFAKKGFVTAGGIGTCDSDYRGSIGVTLMWSGSSGHVPNATEIVVSAGSRIAQLVIVPIPRVELVEVEYDALNKTARGSGGFGSSGR